MTPVAFAMRLPFVAVLLGACHPAAPRPNIGPKAGQSVGDTAAFAPRLLDIDARGPMKFVPVPRTPVPAPSVMSWGSADQADYDRCVRAGTRGLTKKRVVKTDSAGKTSVQITNGADDPQQEIDIERRCESGVNARIRSHSSTPPRFLVLMASNTPLLLADAIQRFETMRNIPRDMTVAVNAVASTLYGDRRGTWSAHYIAW